MKRLMVSTVIIFSALSATAVAQENQIPPNNDLRCFMAAAVAANSNKEQVKHAGLMEALFYAGKIYGVNPNINLTEALKSEMKGFKQMNITEIQKNCAAELVIRGKEISATGNALRDSENSQSPSTN